MEKTGTIEIRIIGKVGNSDLTPETYDFRHIASILQNVEYLLYPNNKKNRPIITYKIEDGSVRHIFKTSIQTIIGFSALLSQVQAQNSIDFLEQKTAKALEEIQKMSRQKDYEFQIKTSLEKTHELIITPSSKFFRTENMWGDAEFYFYGILKDAGGANKAIIRLYTEDYGYLSIETEEKFLKEREENLLYKKFGVRASGKQNIETGEIDTKSLKLLEIIDYTPRFDNEYLKTLIVKAKNNWRGINTDDWLLDLRGSYEA